MLHILRLEGEPPQVDIEEIGTVIDLKRHLKRRHDYPICLQQLLHEQTRLDNSIRLVSLLQDRDDSDASALPNLLDAAIHIQLVVASPSTHAEKAEVDREFRHAYHSGRLKVAQRLLKAGANRDLRTSNRTVLLDAADKGNVAVVRLLLRPLATPDLRDRCGWTALMLGARKGRAEITQLLLQARADKDLRSTAVFKTALMEAANKGHAEIVELLLQAGADKNVSDQYSKKAFMLAAEKGHASSVQWLLKFGAETDLHSHWRRRTALMLATQKGHTRSVQWLLKYGAGKDWEDFFGNTALMFAVDMGHTKILELLFASPCQHKLAS